MAVVVGLQLAVRGAPFATLAVRSDWKETNMTDISPTAWDWAAKGAGAVAGSAVSLAYVMPSGRREAAARFAAGVVMGLIFGAHGRIENRR